MPTVLRVEGYRFYFYSHEPGEPPHVHVDKGPATAKVWLHDGAVARSSGFAAQELGKIQRVVRHARCPEGGVGCILWHRKVMCG